MLRLDATYVRESASVRARKGETKTFGAPRPSRTMHPKIDVPNGGDACVMCALTRRSPFCWTAASQIEQQQQLGPHRGSSVRAAPACTAYYTHAALLALPSRLRQLARDRPTVRRSMILSIAR